MAARKTMVDWQCGVCGVTRRELTGFFDVPAPGVLTLRDALLARLRQIVTRQKTEPSYTPADAHPEADNLLLAYINDEEIADVYRQVNKWYA